MRYQLLAVDYDGTLASGGRVAPETLVALEHLRASGRRLVLVTGRTLLDLVRALPGHELFDAVVAENGGTLRRKGTAERLLSRPPPASLALSLERRGIPFAAGRVIVATAHPYQAALLEVVRDLGLELQLVFNKGSVMVLPSGVNKETGLGAALLELGLTRHEVVAIGDAENDHTMIAAAEVGVALSNAVPSLKERADLVTRSRQRRRRAGDRLSAPGR